MIQLDDIRDLVKKITGLRIDRDNLRFCKETLIIQIKCNKSTKNKDAYQVLLEILQEVNPQMTAAGYKSIPIPDKPAILTDGQKEALYAKQKKLMKKNLKAHKKAFSRKVQRALKVKSSFEVGLIKLRKKKEKKKKKRFEYEELEKHNLHFSDLSEEEPSE